MDMEPDKRLIGLVVVEVASTASPSGKDIALRLGPANRRVFPQRQGDVTFVGVVAVHGNGDLEPGRWQPRGEVQALRFTDGVAQLTLNTYGPGDTWTEQWSVNCLALRNEVRLLPGPTVRAAFAWMAVQWWVWIVLLLMMAAVVARVAHVR